MFSNITKTILITLILIFTTTTTFAEDTKTVDLTDVGKILLPVNVTIQEKYTNGERDYILNAIDHGVARSCGLKFIRIPNMNVTAQTLAQLSPIMESTFNQLVTQIKQSRPDANIIYQEPFSLIKDIDRSIYTASFTSTAQGSVITMDMYYFIHQNNVQYLISLSSEDDVLYWRPIMKKVMTSLPERAPFTGKIYNDPQERFKITFPDDWKVEKIGDLGVHANSPNTFPSITFINRPYEDNRENEIKRIRERQSKDLKDSKYIDSGDTIISGEPALWFLHTFGIQDRVYNYSYVHFVFTSNSYYTFATFGRSSTFPDDKSTVTDILNSVILNPQ